MTLYPQKIIQISIHALLTEGDPNDYIDILRWANFNPRPPHGGRLPKAPSASSSWRFQSTPSSRRATPGRHWGHAGLQFQSTPSSRRATGPGRCPPPGQGISIHALLTEGDKKISSALLMLCIFQSTPSSRRATMVHFIPFNSNSHFNPRPPHGGRPTAFWACFCASRFQSTPSSRRATVCQASQHWHLGGFQSTPSSRRATVRMGGLPRQGIDFNPRPPHGGRRERFAL